MEFFIPKRSPRRRKMLPSVEFSTKPWSRRLETTVKFTRLGDCCSTYKVEIIVYIWYIWYIYIYMIYIYIWYIWYIWYIYIYIIYCIYIYIYILYIYIYIHDNHSWYRACIPNHFLSPPSCPFVVALYRQPNHTPPAAVDPWKLRNPTSQVFF